MHVRASSARSAARCPFPLALTPNAPVATQRRPRAAVLAGALLLLLATAALVRLLVRGSGEFEHPSRVAAAGSDGVRQLVFPPAVAHGGNGTKAALLRRVIRQQPAAGDDGGVAAVVEGLAGLPRVSPFVDDGVTNAVDSAASTVSPSGAPIITVGYPLAAPCEREFWLGDILAPGTRVVDIPAGDRALPLIVPAADSSSSPSPKVDVLFAHVRDASVPEGDGCEVVAAAKIRALCPKAVVLLSDEFGDADCVAEIALDAARSKCSRGDANGATTAPVAVFWQYARRRPPLAGMRRTVPLGYSGSSAPSDAALLHRLPWSHPRGGLIRASSRPLVWSFVGRLKGDRAAILERLGSGDGSAGLSPSLVVKSGEFTAGETHAAYAMSRFVVSPKGNARLDCFRLYEASRVGAIPVVVGAKHAIEAEFGSFVGAERPPWIFADTWADAAAAMRLLAHGPTDAIDRRQRRVLRWWASVCDLLRAELRAAVAPPAAAAKPLR